MDETKNKKHSPQTYLILRQNVEKLPLSLWSADELDRRAELLNELSELAIQASASVTKVKKGISLEDRLRASIKEKSIVSVKKS